MFVLPARYRKCDCRNERRCFGIVISLQLSSVRFHDSAYAIQAKAIMSLSEVSERFPPPILCIRSEDGFRFM